MRPFAKFTRVMRAALACVVMALALFAAPATAEACPTCKDAIAENDPKHQQMVKGYFYSILFMMSMPFVVVGTFGGMAYLSIKRARQNSAGEEDQISNLRESRNSR
jgi:hypothetical protein